MLKPHYTPLHFLPLPEVESFEDNWSGVIAISWNHDQAHCAHAVPLTWIEAPA